MSCSGDSDDGSGPHAVLLWAGCRTLRRSLRPLVWVTLEEVALDAVLEDGRLLARTSARQISDRLGVDPTTVAKALQALRKQGLVSLEREKGPAGRFGLSVYALGAVPGLNVVSPCGADPGVVSPSVVEPVVVESGLASLCMGQPCAETPAPAASGTDRPGMVLPGLPGPDMDEPDMDEPDLVRPEAAEATRGPGSPVRRADNSGRARSRPASPLSQCLGQTSFDLGSVSS